MANHLPLNVALFIGLSIASICGAITFKLLNISNRANGRFNK